MQINLHTFTKVGMNEYFFHTKKDFQEYLLKLNEDEKQNSWWIFEYDSDDLKKNNKESLITNDLLEIVKLWEANKVPPSYAPNNYWDLNIIKCTSKEHAIEMKKGL